MKLTDLYYAEGVELANSRLGIKTANLGAIRGAMTGLKEQGGNLLQKAQQSGIGQRVGDMASKGRSMADNALMDAKYNLSPHATPLAAAGGAAAGLGAGAAGMSAMQPKTQA